MTEETTPAPESSSPAVPVADAPMPGRNSPGIGRGRTRSLHGSLLPFLAPAVIVLLLIGIFPLLYTINLSFRSFSFILPGRDGQWVGLDNYATLIHDPGFKSALLRTAVFTGSAVILELSVGFVLASWLNAVQGMRRLLLSLLIIPMILTPVIIGLMFNFALNPQFGSITHLLGSVGIPGTGDILGGPVSAMIALILVDVWQWSPFMAIMLWAGMQALPSEPLEAAAMDGATALQRMRYVVVPMLRPVVVVAVIFRAAEAVREFDKVFVLTGGGPGSATEVLDLFTYRTSFVTWDMSLGAAMGVVVFIAALASAVIFFRIVARGGRVT